MWMSHWGVRPRGLMMPAPRSYSSQNRCSKQRSNRKPRDTALAGRKHDERRKQGPQRRSRVPADLKQRLRKAMLSTGGQPSHSRRFGVEHSRAHSHQRHRGKNDRKCRRQRKQQNAGQSQRHADRKRIRRRVRVGIDSDDGLENRSGHLKRKRDQSDLPEIEMVRRFENRVNGRYDRLQRVIQQVAHTDRHQDAKSRSLALPA
jgi:hypothetical protein